MWVTHWWFLNINISLWMPPELITHRASICITKTIQGVLVSSLCNLCIHMSQSEQSCRVSWVLSEASSWAEYEHKWCFHSALLSAVWILPQALISMAAAFSLIPGLCYSMCATVRDTHTHILLLTYLLAPPPNYSWILLSMSRFPSWISPPYLLLHTVLPLAHSSSSSFLQLLIFLWFFPLCLFFLTFLPPSPIFSSLSAMY